MKVDHEGEDNDDAEPERRNGKPRDGEDTHNIIYPRVLVHSGNRSEWHRDQNGDECRHQRKLKAELQTNADLVCDRLSGPHRGAEVEAEDTPDPVDKLL